MTYFGKHQIWFTCILLLCFSSKLYSQNDFQFDDSEPFQMPNVSSFPTTLNEPAATSIEPIPTRTSEPKSLDHQSDSAKETKKHTLFAEKFWSYLLSNNYKHWSPPKGKSTDFVANQNPATNPHGVYTKSYVNRTATASTNGFAHESTLVVENYRSDRSLESIAVMYRSRGFNPQANDWFWAVYNPDGSIKQMSGADFAQVQNSNGLRQASAYTSPKKLVGRTTTCIKCHTQAAGNDLVFSNDRSDQLLPMQKANTAQPIQTRTADSNANRPPEIIFNR
jgi:hypothetical protein